MRLKNQKIFMTGGAGFMGVHLCKKLASDNKIIIYDNFQRNAMSRADISKYKNVRFVKGDILDAQFLQKSMEDIDCVIHLAAVAGIDTVIKDPVKTIEINSIGTYNVLEAARHQKSLKRFLYFSTSEVFGPYAYQVREDDSAILGKVGEPRWVYATSKFFSEHMVSAYGRKYKIPHVILRPFNIYGPYQMGEGAIQVFVKQALMNKGIKIFGDGSQIRSWCYIDDLINGILLSLTEKGAIGEVFNIGNPQEPITILNLARKALSLANSKSSITHLSKKSADVYLRVPCVEKAKALLGFKPRVNLDEGLKKTIKWFKQIAL